SIFWTFSVTIATLTATHGAAALRASKELVRPRLGKAFLVIFVLGILNTIANAVISNIGNSMPYEIVFILAIGAFADIVASYFIVANLIFYLNFDATRSSAPPPAATLS
ncbi:MAG TPA: hypothetical protein PKL83_05540, partial [bacterium]|nr:hypothetical protein [bacterium]